MIKHEDPHPPSPNGYAGQARTTIFRKKVRACLAVA